jgi:uncharacterized protein (DUF1800 family)
VAFDALIAVNRFGLGAGPGELAAAKGDPRGWLAGQVSAAPAYPQLAELPPSSEAVKEFPRWLMKVRARRAEMFQFSAGDPTVPCIVEDGKYVQSGWGDPLRG